MARCEVHLEPRLGWFHIVHAHNVGFHELSLGTCHKEIHQSITARVASAGVQLQRRASSSEQLPWQEVRLEFEAGILVILDSVHESCGWWVSQLNHQFC